MSMFESRGNLSLATESEAPVVWENEKSQLQVVERIRTLGNFTQTLIDPSHVMAQVVMMREARAMGADVPEDGIDYDGISRSIEEDRLEAGLDDILIANYVRIKYKFTITLLHSETPRPDLWADSSEIAIAENFVEKAENFLNHIAEKHNINADILTGKKI